MKKLKKIVVAFFVVLMVVSFSSCGSSPKNEIVGTWVYNDRGDIYITFNNDGTFYWNDENVSGTFSVDKDKSLFMEVSLYDWKEVYEWDENYSDYINGTWYVGDDFLIFDGTALTRHGKDRDKILEKATKKAEKEYESEDDSEEETEESQVKYLDAFSNLEVSFAGISPYCEVIINTSSCPQDVQQYVEYSTDKESYANGEKVIVTAQVNPYYTDQYAIKKVNESFEVSGMPEYITSVEGVDLTEVKKELNDAITSNVAAAIKHGQEGYLVSSLLGNDVSCQLQSVNSVDAADIYFSSLKPNRRSTHEGYYNMLSFTYKVSYTGIYDSGTFYSCITAVNIVRYPDGTIKWGSENSDDLDFIEDSAQGSIENCVTTLIMCNKDNYNISKVTL